MFEAWRKLNEDMLYDKTIKIVMSMGCYAWRSGMVMTGDNFNMPTDHALFQHQRVPLLEQRYRVVQKDLEDFVSNKGSTARALRIERHQVGKRALPKAGGCLLSVIVAADGHVTVTSRAAEVSLALYHDIILIGNLMERLKVKVKRVTWVIGAATQNRVFVPVIAYDHLGPAEFKKWLRRKGKSKWEEVCREHGAEMLDEKSNMKGTRLRWARRLRTWMEFGR